MTHLSYKGILRKYFDLWHELSGWKLFLFYALHYTLLFLILQYIVFFAFYEADKSFIWTVDGVGSWIPRLIYIRQTLRDGIQNLLKGNGWTIPLYDFRIGPVDLDLQIPHLYWLSVFWPLDKVDLLNDILVITRFYLLGISFSVMGFYFKQKLFAIIIGAVTYTFSAVFLFAGVTHPPFLMPAIFLPLFIIGVEHILQEKRGFLLLILCFLSLIESLYLSCMMIILVVIYFLVRFFCAYNSGIRSFFRTVSRAILWGGVGAALSGVVLVPTLLQMLGTGRIGRDVGELWNYPLSYYKTFISSFILDPSDILRWTYMGFSALAIPAIALLFFHTKRYPNNKSLRILFIVLTIMMCIPIAAYILSGFNDISNRWCYAYSLCVSAIIMFVLPQLEKSKHSLAFAGSVSLLYVLIYCFFLQKKIYHEESFIFLLIAFLLIACCHFSGNSGKKAVLPICLFLTCTSVCYSAFWCYDTSAGNYVESFINNDEIYSIYEAGQYASLGESNVVKRDDNFFRVSANNLSQVDATVSFYWDLKGLSFYTSAINNYYKKMWDSLEMLQRGTNIWRFGIDSRAPVLSLFNVKYDAVRGNAPIPYGFEKVDEVNQDVILENQYFLPVGYTYDAYMKKDDFDQLSPIEKQEAMLQALVLGDELDRMEFCESPDLQSRKMPVKVAAVDGLSWKNGKLKVKKEKATMTLSFDGIAGADTYLRVNNLDLTKGTSTRRWYLTVATEKTSTNARFTADGWLYSNGAKDQVLYLGNSPDGYTTCTLTFPQKGTFVLDDLEIWCQPMEHYAEQIESLRAESLENVETNWRGLTGTISVSKDKFLCFSIPYDEGWSAYVDGKKVQLFQVNIGFMGVELPAGDHEIELKYWPPGLTCGIILSSIGLIGLIFLIVWQRKKIKREKTKSVVI